MLGKLERHRLGEAGEPVLGGDVGALEGRGPQRMRRADVDDAPPLALLHAGHSRARRVEGRGQIDGNDRVPLLDGELLHGRHVLDAGVVHQDVDRAEVALRLGDHLRDLIVAEHVCRVEGDAGGMLFDLGDSLLVVLLGAEPVENHVGAVLGERMGDAQTDARGRPGDDSGLTFETHDIPLSAISGVRGCAHPAAKPQRCLSAPPGAGARKWAL